MVVCKNCGTVYEEYYNACPKCGTVHQLPDDSVYNVPRRRMPGTQETGTDPQYVEIELGTPKKKSTKAPTIIFVLITLVLLAAAAITIAVVFAGKNDDGSSEKPAPEPKEQSSQSVSVPESEPSQESKTPQESSDAELTSDVSVSQDSQVDLAEPVETSAVVVKTELSEEAYTDNDGNFHEAAYKVFVRYNVGGIEYETELGVFSENEYKSSDVLEIMYDKADPNRIKKIFADME